jgi:hypothetical protein
VPLAVVAAFKEVGPGMTALVSVTITETKAGAVTVSVVVPVTVPAAGLVKLAEIVVAPGL